MSENSKKRQNFAKSLRQKKRQQFFAQKRSNFLLGSIRQTLPDPLALFFRETVTLETQVQAMISAQQCISILSQRQITSIIETCKKYLDSGDYRNKALATLVEITNLKNLTEQTILFLRNSLSERVVEILKTSKVPEQKLNCCYIYGNLIVDIGIKTEEDFKLAHQILNIFNRQEEMLDGDAQAVESLIWMIKNSILVFVKTNSQGCLGTQEDEDVMKERQKYFGGYCLSILCEIIQKEIRREIEITQLSNLKTHKSFERCFVLQQLELFQLILSHKIYQKDHSLSYFDQIMARYFNQQSIIENNAAINKQIITICTFLVGKIGLAKGIRSIVTNIVDFKIQVPNGLELCTIVNEMGAGKLYKLCNDNSSFKSYMEFIKSMNNKVYPILEQQLKNPQTLINRAPRAAVMRYLLSNPDSIQKVDTDAILNLLDVALIDAQQQHILEALKVVDAFVVEADQQGIIDQIKRLLQEFGIAKALLDLQMNKNKEIYELSLQIIDKINLEQ